MLTFLKRLLWVSAAIALIGFSVSNRHQIPLHVPLTPLTLSLPLFWVFFLGLFTGLMLSAFALSWSRLKSFVARRQAERETVHLKARLKGQDDNTRKAEAATKIQAVTEAAKE